MCCQKYLGALKNAFMRVLPVLASVMFAIVLGAEARAEDKPLTIYFVGATSPGDPFHGIIARGAEQAGKDLGVRVVYIFPDKVTLSDYNNKIEQAIAARPDGIVILGIDEKGTEPLAQRAHDLGIKLGFNPAPSIKDRPLWSSDDLYVSRVGSDEYSAGVKAAERLLAADVKGSVVCANPVPGDATVATRCQGLIDRLKEAGIQAQVVEIALDPGLSTELLTTYLRAHSDVGAIVGTGATSNAAAREAKSTSGLAGLLIGGFDLDPATLQSIKAGAMLFTIDQQPFWRGYIPVLELTHNIRYGLQQANYFLSGPSIVDAANAEQIMKLSKEGVR